VYRACKADRGGMLDRIVEMGLEGRAAHEVVKKDRWEALEVVRKEVVWSSDPRWAEGGRGRGRRSHGRMWVWLEGREPWLKFCLKWT
jgi:hypothetical protein